jgi:hypothetical protein
MRYKTEHLPFEKGEKQKNFIKKWIPTCTEMTKVGGDECYLPEEPFVVIVIAYPKPRNRISIKHAQRSHA